MIDVPENTAKRNGDQMRTEKWIIFGMLVALLAGCSGKKAAEISVDAKVGSWLAYIDEYKKNSWRIYRLKI